MREREPHPVRPHEQLLPGAEAVRARQPPLQAQRGRRAPADEAVRLDRVLDPHALHQLLGIVVGHLVRDEVGVHLQRAHARRPARASAGLRPGRRASLRRRRSRRGLQAEPAAEQRRREAGGEHRAGGRADGGRAGHGRRIYRRPRTGQVRPAPVADYGSPGVQALRDSPAPRAASATNDRTTRERGSTSGCHWTPRAQRDSGTSIASTRSSSTLQPVATTPSPSDATAWWWCDLVA